jgi:hypothetical protein
MQHQHNNNVIFNKPINSLTELINELRNNRGGLRQGRETTEQGKQGATTENDATGSMGAEEHGGSVENGESSGVLPGLGGRTKKPKSGSTTNADGRDDRGCGRASGINNVNDKVACSMITAV